MNCFTLILVVVLISVGVEGYSLRSNWTGSSFFNNFNFFTENDPTHGYVNYVSQSAAQSGGYISTSGNVVTIGCDTKNVASGRGRDSVRLTSKSAFNNGLFIMDLQAMPTGCGSWPAWWLVGPSWPNGGEIDIIEGVNVDSTDATTLHTNNGCTMNGSSNQFSGRWSPGTNGQPALNCYVSAPNQNNNQGCGIIGGGYGESFNAQGGGVYVLEWTKNLIRSFYFPRNAIPKDIANPNPDNWGKPTALFQLGNNCPASHFVNMTMVINLTFCGDWAGNVFSQQCPGKGACNAYVQNNPGAFAKSKWIINYISNWA